MPQLRRASHGRLPRVVLLIESSRSSGRCLLRGIADYARDHGPWAFYWEPGGLEKAWPRLKSLDADGIILRDVERLDDVVSQGIPAIVVEHSKGAVQGLANVVTDSESIGSMAARHLVSCGFRHFAYCGLRGAPWSDLRGESFARQLQASGFRAEVYPQSRLKSSAGWREERRQMAEWLNALPKPLGIMACNDDRAEQVIEACKVAGIQVPDQLGIIGADNDDLVCDLSDPPLSSVAINFERAGYESARILHSMMRGGGSSQRQVTAAATHVVPRRSTDVVAVDDPALAKALRHIRDHTRTLLAVPEVVRASGLSRRVLEKRFQKSLRRSVLAEIRRLRVEQICRLLVETDLPVSRIAHNLGFDGVEHVARYFRREKNETPLAFRRRHRPFAKWRAIDA